MMENVRVFESYLETLASVADKEIRIRSKQELKEGISVHTEVLVMAMLQGQARHIVDTYRKRIETYVRCGGSTFLQGGSEVILTKSARHPSGYQFTYFDKHGPISHGECQSMEEMVTYVREHQLVPLRKEWMELV